MYPTLKVGSLIYYKNIDINDYNDGDILVYRLNEHIISHRIVEINNDYFITKGDNNNVVDSNKVVYSQLLGKGTNFCILYLGYYADFIYNHKYILILLLGLTLIDIVNGDKNDKEI
jgi:signal peptidase